MSEPIFVYPAYTPSQIGVVQNKEIQSSEDVRNGVCGTLDVFMLTGRVKGKNLKFPYYTVGLLDGLIEETENKLQNHKKRRSQAEQFLREQNK